MEEPLLALWEKVLAALQTRVSKTSFDTWLKSTRAIALDDHYLQLITPNEFTREWLEMRYAEIIKTIVFELTGKTVEIGIEIRPDEDDLKPVV